MYKIYNKEIKITKNLKGGMETFIKPGEDGNISSSSLTASKSKRNVEKGIYEPLDPSSSKMKIMDINIDKKKKDALFEIAFSDNAQKSKAINYLIEAYVDYIDNLKKDAEEELASKGEELDGLASKGDTGDERENIEGDIKLAQLNINDFEKKINEVKQAKNEGEEGEKNILKQLKDTYPIPIINKFNNEGKKESELNKIFYEALDDKNEQEKKKERENTEIDDVISKLLRKNPKKQSEAKKTLIDAIKNKNNKEQSKLLENGYQIDSFDYENIDEHEISIPFLNGQHINFKDFKTNDIQLIKDEFDDFYKIVEAYDVVPEPSLILKKNIMTYAINFAMSIKAFDMNKDQLLTLVEYKGKFEPDRIDPPGNYVKFLNNNIDAIRYEKCIKIINRLIKEINPDCDKIYASISVDHNLSYWQPIQGGTYDNLKYILNGGNFTTLTRIPDTGKIFDNKLRILEMRLKSNNKQLSARTKNHIVTVINKLKMYEKELYNIFNKLRNATSVNSNVVDHEDPKLNEKLVKKHLTITNVLETILATANANVDSADSKIFAEVARKS